MTGSLIPQWITLSSATFNVTFTTPSGNYAKPDAKSHYKADLTANGKTAAGRTDTSVSVIPLKGSNALQANLHIDWWLHPRAAEKDSNLANLEKQHTFGDGSNIKGLLEKGGYWERMQSEHSTYSSHFSGNWAAYFLASELRAQLDIARSAQRTAWDVQKGAQHDYPPF